MHNEFKTLAYLIKYIEKKLNGDVKLNRLMRYLTPYPYESKSPTYDEDSNIILDQPNINNKLLKEFNKSEKCLYCRDSNMENYPVEEMPTIFVHPTFIYFGDKNNNPQGSYIIRFAVTCSAKQREMWDENDIPTDRLFEIGQRISKHCTRGRTLCNGRKSIGSSCHFGRWHTNCRERFNDFLFF